MCQPLPRDRLPAMENHSRSVIPSTYSQKHSVATTLHKRESNRGNEREGIWVCVHRYMKKNRALQGGIKFMCTLITKGPIVSEGGRKLGKENTLGNTDQLQQGRQLWKTQFICPGHYGEPNETSACLTSRLGKSEVWFKADILNLHIINFIMINLVTPSREGFLAFS